MRRRVGRPSKLALAPRDAALAGVREIVSRTRCADFKVLDLKRASGVGTATIYKFWPEDGQLPTKVALLADYFDSVLDRLKAPDGGRLETDLARYFHDVQILATNRSGFGPVLLGLLAASDLKRKKLFDSRVWQACLRVPRKIVAGAQHRQEIPAGADAANAAIELIWAAALRLLASPIPGSFGKTVDRLTALVLKGVRADK